MNERYFIVHWMAQVSDDSTSDDHWSELEEEGEDYGPSIVRGKLYIRTGNGRYVNETGLIQMVLDSRSDLDVPYIDRVEELNRSDYEDYIRGNPNVSLDDMKDPYSPRDFA